MLIVAYCTLFRIIYYLILSYLFCISYFVHVNLTAFVTIILNLLIYVAIVSMKIILEELLLE